MTLDYQKLLDAQIDAELKLNSISDKNSQLYKDQLELVKKFSTIIGGKTQKELEKQYETQEGIKDLIDSCVDLQNDLTSASEATYAGSSKMLNVLKAQQKYQREIVNLKAKEAEKADEIFSREQGSLAIRELAVKALKGSWEMWKKLDDEAFKHGRTLGMTTDEVSSYRAEIIAQDRELATLYGEDEKYFAQIRQSYSKITQTSKILHRDTINALAASKKIMGEENTTNIMEAIDNIGGSAQRAAGASAQMIARARNQGLDITKAGDNLNKALKMSQKYTFREGVDGMTKMVAKAQALKLSMESIGNMAEKFYTIEDSIQSSAKLQVLGGSLATTFSNPMEMMGLVHTDMAAFTDKIEGAFDNVGRFNKETGQVDISDIDKMRMRAAAEALGISQEEFATAVAKRATAKEAEAALRSSGKMGELGKEEQEWFKNNAQFDEEKQKWYVQDANGDKTFLEKLTDEKIAEVKKRQTAEDAIADDVHNILGLIKNNEDWAQAMKSWNESQVGMSTSAGAAGATGVNLFSKWFLDPIKKIFSLHWTTAILGVGLGGLIKSFGDKTASKFVKKGFKGFKGGTKGFSGGAMPATSIASSNATSAGFNGNYRAARQLGMNHEEALSAASSDYRAGGGSRMGAARQRAKMRFKRGMTRTKAVGRKMGLNKLGKFMKGKKGKVGLALGLALAGGYLMSRNSGDSAAEGDVAPGDIDSGGDGDIYNELHKQTQLLEAIASKMGAVVENTEDYGDEEEYGESGGGSYEHKSVLGDRGEGLAVAEAIADQTVDSAGTYAAEMKLAQWGGKRLATKMGTNVATKAAGGPLTWAGLGIDLANMGGQAMGWWDEGGAVDKTLSIGSSTATGAAIGSAMIPIPVVGTAVGAIVGAVYGVADAFGEDMRNQANEWISEADLSIGGGMKLIGGLALHVASSSVNLVKDSLDIVGNVVGDAVGGVWDAAKNTAVGVWDASSKLIEGDVLGAIGVVGETFVENMKIGGEALWSMTKDVVKGVGNVAYDILDTMSFGVFGSVWDSAFASHSEEEKAQMRAKANADIDKKLFETQKMGPTDISDPQLMQKAALATIQIHDQLTGYFNKQNGLDADGYTPEEIAEMREEANSVGEDGWAKKAADWVGEKVSGAWNAVTDFFGFADGGGTDDRVLGKLKKAYNGDNVLATFNTKETVLNEEQMTTLASKLGTASSVIGGMLGGPIGSVIANGVVGGATNILQNPMEAMSLVKSPGVQDINLHIDGTLKLTGNNGSSANIDVKELANNKEFKDMIFNYVASQMDKKGQLGVGSNKNSSYAMRGYGVEAARQ